MARTIVVFGPSGITLPNIDLVTAADAVEESISLTEDSFAKGRYTGTVTTSNAGNYVGVVKSNTSVIGTFERVTVTAVDPETVIVRDLVDVDQMTAVLALLQGLSITVTSPVIGADQKIELVQGMDYKHADTRALYFTGATADQWPDLTGATVTIKAIQGQDSFTKNGIVTAPTGTQAFYFEFAAAELTAALTPTGTYRYNVTAVLGSGNKVELVKEGSLRVEAPFGEDEL